MKAYKDFHEGQCHRQIFISGQISCKKFNRKLYNHIIHR